MSVSRLTSSSWRVPSGERPPSAVPTTVNATSPALPPTSTATASRTRAHIARPSASASTRRVRSASVSTRSAERRAAGDSAPARSPDAHPDVGEPDRRGVVHPVAGHRQRRAGLAQRRHERHLLLRRQPREHRRLPHHADPLGVRRPEELGPGDDPVRVRYPGLGGDRGRGLGVVAGRDQHAHPGRAQLGDGERRRLADAVGERDQPAQREAMRRGIEIQRSEVVGRPSGRASGGHRARCRPAGPRPR